MSIAGALFTIAITALVVLGVSMELAWRGRQRAAAESALGLAAVPGAARQAPPPRRACWPVGAVVGVVVQAVVVAALTAALSVASALVLARGQLDGSLQSTWASLAGWAVLAALAAAVAVLFAGAGRLLAPVLGTGVAFVFATVPAWVVAGIALAAEGDALWLVALVTFMAMSAVATALTWAVVAAVRGGQPLARRVGAANGEPQRQVVRW